MAGRFYIATRDPADGGGVAALSRFVYETAERAGYNPCLVYNTLDRSKQIRLDRPWDVLGFGQTTTIDHLTRGGLEMKAIPVVFPEIEFTQYRLNGAAWDRAIQDGDLFMTVAGTNLCSVPLVRGEHPFASWTATLLWDDRQDRLESAARIERVRDRLSRPILEHIERRGYRRAEPPMVISEYTANRIAERHGIPRTEIDVVPYPVDTRHFRPEEPASLATDGRIVLFAGRLNDPRKNVRYLIEAFSSFADAMPDVQLWLLGANPGSEILQAVDEQGVADRVEFYGKVPYDDLPGYYGAADVFALPSRQEGLGIVGLEALACGTPVVSTRCGGPEAYVQPGENGYLVPTDDAEKFASRIVTLLSDKNQRRTFGRAGRDLVEREYSEWKIENRFVRLFDDLNDRESG